MSKIVKNTDPLVIPASGDAEAIAQANLSEDKDIKDLLTGDSKDEAKSSL